jgi:hypothetical protein
VELKSLKLYIWSFRDQGKFHEAVTNEILDHLVDATSPRFMRLTGEVLRARRDLHHRRRRAPQEGLEGARARGARPIPPGIEYPLRGSPMKYIAAALLIAAGAAYAEPPTIEALFQPPRFGALRISPDGKTIAALAPVAGRQNLVVLDTATKKPNPVTGFNNRDVVEFDWINSKRLLVRSGSLATPRFGLPGRRVVRDRHRRLRRPHDLRRRRRRAGEQRRALRRPLPRARAHTAWRDRRRDRAGVRRHGGWRLRR